MVGHIKHCQICGEGNLQVILAYGHQRPVHGHRTLEQLHEEETHYPLNLCFCEGCGLVQLDYIVDPATVFYPEYPYMSGMTNMLVRNFENLANVMFERFTLSSTDLVIDIGSNDGSLLKPFQAKGAKVLGIEATNIAKIANQNGVLTWQEFFNADTVRRISDTHGKAKVVTAANVFAHIPNPVQLGQAIREILTEDGIFVSESQYLYETVSKLQLDEVYDEHLRYYSLKPYMRLMKLVGMSVVDAERIDAAGGSIRIFARVGEHPASENVMRIIEEEEKLGLYDIVKLKQFGVRAMSVKHDLLALVLQCKKQGSVVGIGGAARSNTLLGFANIDNSMLDYAVEKAGSPKIGLFTPGTHIPIVDEEIVFREQPEFGLLLSWHIGDELMQIFRDKGYKGKFIVPLPTPRIVHDV